MIRNFRLSAGSVSDSLIAFLEGRSNRDLTGIYIRSNTQRISGVYGMAVADLPDATRRALEEADFNRDWQRHMQKSEVFYSADAGELASYVFRYRREPFLAIVFNGRLPDEFLNTLTLAKNVVLQEYRTVSFERLMDRYSRELSGSDDALGLRLAPSSVAKTQFLVDHIISFDGKSPANYELESSGTFSNSPAERFLSAGSNTSVFDSSQSDNLFFRVDISASGKAAISRPHDSVTQTDGSTSTFLWMRRRVGRVLKSLLYAWDNFVVLTPGDRSALEFMMNVHISQSHLADDAQLKLEQARQFGQFEQSTRIGDAFRSVRHALDRKTQSAIADIQSVREKLSSKGGRESTSEIIMQLKAVEASLQISAETIDSIQEVGVFLGDIDPESMKVGDIRSDVIDFFKATFRDNDVSFLFQGFLEGRLLGYRNWLVQLFANLIGNSLDLFEERGLSDRTITINSRKAASGGVEFTYSDTAGGFRRYSDDGSTWELMTTEQIEQCFEKNESFRSPGAAARGEYMHGYGLWLIREYLEIHRGTVTVTKNSDNGATFTFNVADRPRDDVLV